MPCTVALAEYAWTKTLPYQLRLIDLRWPLDCQAAHGINQL